VSLLFFQFCALISSFSSPRGLDALEKFWSHGRAAPAAVELPQEKKIGEKN